MGRLTALLVLVPVLAACATSHPHVSAHVSSSAPASSPAPTPDPDPGPSCTSQVMAWLATSDNSGIPANTVQHDISAVISAAKDYQLFHVPNPSDPYTGPQAGQFFLNHMTDSNYQGIADPSMAIPSCADPAGDWQTFLNDASTASGDISGTSQADSDAQTTINDLAALNAELKTNAPGVQIKGI